MLVPVPTRDPATPATDTHLIKCGCKKTSCTSHCSCRSQGLNCSEMCLCGADEEVSSNVNQALFGIEEDEEEGKWTLKFYPTLADQNQPDGGPKELNKTCFSCEIITVLKIKKSKTPKNLSCWKECFFLNYYITFSNILGVCFAYRMYFGVI